MNSWIVFFSYLDLKLTKTHTHTYTDRHRDYLIGNPDRDREFNEAFQRVERAFRTLTDNDINDGTNNEANNNADNDENDNETHFNADAFFVPNADNVDNNWWRTWVDTYITQFTWFI